jgi:TonB family protein
MRPVFSSVLVLQAFTAFAGGQDGAISPQHMELPSRYPNVARAARLQGTITVKLTVSDDGTVIAANSNSPDVADLTRRWRFACSNCTKENTHPYDVTFTYRLEGKESANSDIQIAVDMPNHITVTAHPPIAMPE